MNNSLLQQQTTAHKQTMHLLRTDERSEHLLNKSIGYKLCSELMGWFSLKIDIGS